ncbi:MAG TPA: ribonuclease Z [Acidimicrobiaceae bacterium]|uniref:MBL fold metallo-hydrolase n=1 Tax=Microbacterium maritypicum TaxID=33918 RepID=UPI000ED54AD7|nr:MBL fold metallo-hydrolase [Microbacterium liquefaciens]HCB37490.1 ribonuclease Z [Acidimicrobiaceae bacterium]
MKVTLGGTGSPLPDAARAGPMTLVEAGPDADADAAAGGQGAPAGTASTGNPTRLMFDAGRGAVMRLAAAGLFPVQLDAVLLTHLHSDHICALNDVITTHWVMTLDPQHRLPIYGPRRTTEMVDGLMAMLAPDVEFRLAHHRDLEWAPQHDVVEVAPGDTFSLGDAAVTVGRTSHAPVEPSVGYRVACGGASVVIAGDGVPCDELDELCAGADAYVQTVLRPELVRAMPSKRLQDILEYHSSVADAAQTAARAGVRTLVLTHYLPQMAPGAEQEWRDIAAEHFDGEVVVGDDLTSFTLPRLASGP